MVSSRWICNRRLGDACHWWVFASVDHIRRDVAEFPDVPTYVATYSYNDSVALESLTKVLFGEVSPTGTLPVDILAKDDPSQVLFPFGAGLTW